MKMITRLERESHRIVFNIIIAILAIGSVVLFHRNTLLTGIILILVSILGLFVWKSKITLAVFLFCAIAFGVAEIFVASFKIWTYAIPTSLGVPIWLFLLWGITGAFIYQTSKEIKKLGVKDE
jgi:hypothetical protein